MSKPEPEFRPLTSRERAILDVLLSVPFIGRDELVAQVAVAQGRSLDDEGSVELRVLGADPAAVAERVPVEAETYDPDGMSVSLLLHVVDGYAVELDVFRADSKPRPVEIDPASLAVTVGPLSDIQQR